METLNGVDLFGNKIAEVPLLSRDKLANVLRSSMYGITAEQLSLTLYSRYEAIVDFARLMRDEDAGEKISMLFNPHRYETRRKDAKSIIDGFSDDRFFDGLARASLFKADRVRELLYQVLQLHINGYGYVNEFPPAVARKIYLSYSASRILDPCAGWGGRMIGAASVGAYYHGFEPSTKTYTGLIALADFLKQFDTGFRCRLDNIPFEEAILDDDYDVALTSPPYYDTELYAPGEPTQSHVKYRTFRMWCDNFYRPLVERTMPHVTAFVLNVGDRQYPLQQELRRIWPYVAEADSFLSGSGGLRNNEGRERFFVLTSEPR